MVVLNSRSFCIVTDHYAETKSSIFHAITTIRTRKWQHWGHRPVLARTYFSMLYRTTPSCLILKTRSTPSSPTQRVMQPDVLHVFNTEFEIHAPCSVNSRYWMVDNLSTAVARYLHTTPARNPPDAQQKSMLAIPTLFDCCSDWTIEHCASKARKYNPEGSSYKEQSTYLLLNIISQTSLVGALQQLQQPTSKQKVNNDNARSADRGGGGETKQK